MGNLLLDLRYGVRMLLKRPGFTAAAVISLALGIGACTAIFSIVDAVLLRSLPYPEPERIVQLREITAKSSQSSMTELNYLDVRARHHSFEAIAQYASGLGIVTGGSQPVRTNGAVVSNEFFKVMGTQPVIGRGFLPEETRPSGEQFSQGRGFVPSTGPVIVSYGFWQRLLGGRQDLSAIKLRIDGELCNVVGVMPPGFAFPIGAEFWKPRELQPPDLGRTAHNWRVVARLRPEVSLQQGVAELSTIGKQLRQAYGKETDAVDMTAIPLQEVLVGKVASLLWIILAAVGFLLLVACTNVANLLLAQMTTRQKEFALRMALGAGKARLARQFITENLLLALTGGVIGVLISYWGVDFLIGLNRASLPRASEIAVDSRVLAFTIVLAFLVAIVLGLLPLTRFGGRDLQSDLKSGGSGGIAHGGGSRIRGLFVISQVSLTLILLVGAGLLGRSFQRLLQVDPGFQPEGAVAMNMNLPTPDSERTKLQAARHQFYQQMLDRLSQLPGVIAVGGVSGLPLDKGLSDGGFLINNDPSRPGYADFGRASEGYFAAMRIPLLRGRLFDKSDLPESQPVAVISQTAAKKFWPNQDPIGQGIQFGNMDGDMRLLNIVGIVGDVHNYGLDQDVVPVIYANAMQRPAQSDLSVVVRTQSDPAALIPAMRQAVNSLNPELPTSFRTLGQLFSSSLDSQRFSLVIFSVFAVVALILAMTGIYGVMAYVVTQRIQEVGIRMALGAAANDILKLIIGGGLKLIIPGVIIGIVGAFGLTRFLATMLFDIKATDPITFAGVALLLALIGLLACWIPARRAARVDPMIALRHD